MKIRLPHAPYIANKIAIDLLNCGFVTMLKSIEPVVKVAEDLITADIKKETAFEDDFLLIRAAEAGQGLALVAQEYAPLRAVSYRYWINPGLHASPTTS